MRINVFRLYPRSNNDSLHYWTILHTLQRVCRHCFNTQIHGLLAIARPIHVNSKYHCDVVRSAGTSYQLAGLFTSNGCLKLTVAKQKDMVQLCYLRDKVLESKYYSLIE